MFRLAGCARGGALARLAPGKAAPAALRAPGAMGRAPFRELSVVASGTDVRFKIPGRDEQIVTIDEEEIVQRRDQSYATRLVQWYPGHIARAEKQLKEQLRLVDVILDVRDTRIPLSTGHPSVPEWIGGKLRLVVLNQMDKVSEAERSRWASYFTRAANTRVVFTNARTGEGVPRLTKLALSVSEGLNARRKEKGLRPRPVRVAVVGFPNVGKSALINRLVGRAQCASAARPGVTRHLQWVSLGADGALMLLDAPGVLPMRMADQAAAVRLAICNDIGEASYTTSLVAAQFVEQLRLHDVSSKRMGALEARYHVSPTGLTGEAFIDALAERSCDGDVERAGRRILKDYQEGRLGAFCLEQPPREDRRDPESAWMPDGPSRRVVRAAAAALR